MLSTATATMNRRAAWLQDEADASGRRQGIGWPRRQPADHHHLQHRAHVLHSRSPRSLIEERHHVPIKPGAGNTSRIAARQLHPIFVETGSINDFMVIVAVIVTENLIPRIGV